MCQITELYTRATRYANRKAHLGDSSDFPAWLVAQVIQKGKEPPKYLKHAYIDYLRATRHTRAKDTVHIVHSQLAVDLESVTDPDNSLYSAILSLTGRRSAIAIYYVMGYTLAEIGDKLELTESRVGQIMDREVIPILRARML